MKRLACRSATRLSPRSLRPIMQPQEPQPESAGPFPVYLPHDGSPISRIVLQRSALVGFPLEFKPELVRIFFEGNRFNVEALRRYADRVIHAAGRCRWFRFDAASWSKEYPGQPPPQVERGYAIYPTSAQSV